MNILMKDLLIMVKNYEDSKDVHEINNEQGNFYSSRLYQHKKTVLSIKKNVKKFISSKTIFSFVFLNTFISGSLKRNKEANGKIKISKFKFIDHNYSFIKVNASEKVKKHLNEIFENKIFEILKEKIKE